MSSAARAADNSGPASAAAPLAAGLAAVRGLRARLAALGLDDTARYEIDFRLGQKEGQFEQALLLTHGIRLEALADDGLVTVGQPIKLSLVAGNNGPSDVTVKSVTLHGLDSPTGPGPAAASCAGAVATGGALTCPADVRVGHAALSGPYWTPRTDAARYDFAPDVPFGVPFRPTPFRASSPCRLQGPTWRSNARSNSATAISSRARSGWS